MLYESFYEDRANNLCRGTHKQILFHCDTRRHQRTRWSLAIKCINKLMVNQRLLLSIREKNKNFLISYFHKNFFRCLNEKFGRYLLLFMVVIRKAINLIKFQIADDILARSVVVLKKTPKNQSKSITVLSIFTQNQFCDFSPIECSPPIFSAVIIT